jgi:transcriptional regulator with XRE-family HTH domain
MDFPERLVQLRKAHSLTQRQLSEQIGVHLTQLQRYESGASQPTLDVLRRLAVALSVSADVLLFDQSERGPDEALKLKFEALRQFDQDERRIAEGVLDSLIVQHQAKRLFGKSDADAEATKPAPAQRGRTKSRTTAQAGR